MLMQLYLFLYSYSLHLNRICRSVNSLMPKAMQMLWSLSNRLIMSNSVSKLKILRFFLSDFTDISLLGVVKYTNRKIMLWYVYLGCWLERNWAYGSIMTEKRHNLTTLFTVWQHCLRATAFGHFFGFFYFYFFFHNRP